MNTGEAVCKGSFMLGTACGSCARCKENLAQISAQTGLVKDDRVSELEDVIEKYKETIATLELANETLKRRVASLEADR